MLRVATLPASTVFIAPPAPGAPGAHPGLRAWHDPRGAGAVAYAEVPGARIVAGVPRAEPGQLPSIVSGFEDACRSRGIRVVHFGVPGPVLEFLERPVAGVHLGDLPVFALARWRADATIPAGIRAQTRRALRRGVRIRCLSAPPPDLSPLLACRDAWLCAKPLPPLGFMTTPFVLDPWPGEGVFVAEREGAVVGFLAASRILFGDVLRVDVVARHPDAPNGTAELLVREAFRHAALRGDLHTTLGLAPLSRRGNGGGSRGWNALVRLAGRACGPLYSFGGLETFKARFRPDAWVPLYCAGSSGRVGVADALAVARAFAGGSLRRYVAAAFSWWLRPGARAGMLRVANPP